MPGLRGIVQQRGMMECFEVTRLDQVEALTADQVIGVFSNTPEDTLGAWGEIAAPHLTVEDLMFETGVVEESRRNVAKAIFAFNIMQDLCEHMYTGKSYENVYEDTIIAGVRYRVWVGWDGVAVARLLKLAGLIDDPV